VSYLFNALNFAPLRLCVRHKNFRPTEYPSRIAIKAKRKSHAKAQRRKENEGYGRGVEISARSFFNWSRFSLIPKI